MTRMGMGTLLSIAALVAAGCLGHSRRAASGDDEEGELGDADDRTRDETVDPVEDEPVVDEPTPEEPADDPPPDEGTVPDGRGPYPAGPYGVWNGDTMRNYSFLTGDGAITLDDVRRDASHDVLLLYLGSASCAYCSTESPELNQLYAAHERDGLEIFGVLSDDDTGPPTGASADRYFADQYDAQYPYGANEWVDGTLMTDLYPDGNVALPMNFVIDLETMEILERMDGYPEQGGITPLIEAWL